MKANRRLLQRHGLLEEVDLNIVRNRVEAEREVRKAQKALRNFEILSKDLSAEIRRLHALGLKSARAELERAIQRVDRAKELVKLRIQEIRGSSKRVSHSSRFVR